MKKKSVRTITEAGLIAALYTALTLAIPYASYGMAQLRVSELLTILPVFTPAAIPGLAVGCVVSNLIGLAFSTIGPWDVLFGSLATLGAACLTYAFRHIRIKGLPVLSTLPPVILNAVVVGLEIAIVDFSWVLYGTAMLYVGAGQLIACTAGGLLLYAALTRSGVQRRLWNGQP